MPHCAHAHFPSREDKNRGDGDREPITHYGLSQLLSIHLSSCTGTLNAFKQVVTVLPLLTWIQHILVDIIRRLILL